MRFAFITPTLHSLGKRWRSDPQIIKLGVPTLSGYLYARGFKDIRQYDFEVEVLDEELRNPGRVNLRAFFDDQAVDRYLKDSDDVIAQQVDLLFDLFDIQEADVFGLSCATSLQIYADMHATGNICMCLCKGIKKRFPRSTTIIGGLQISPDSEQRAEYLQMLERCEYLDFAGDGAGEIALETLLGHLDGSRPLDGGPKITKVKQGILLERSASEALQLAPSLAREIKLKTPKKIETPDEAPEGDHERQETVNDSIKITPYFDQRNIEKRKVKGFEILRRYHLDRHWKDHVKQHLDSDVVVVPMIFMEGCNARCAFCGYSMTKLAKRDLNDVVQGIAWIRETYDARYFHFLNTNINASYKYAEAFCDALIDAKLDILWSDCANLWAFNERLIDKLVQSGCIRLTFGVECPSDRMLKYIHKGIDVKQAHQRLKYAHEAGIWNHLLLITGLPTETPEDSRQFVDFLEQSAEYAHGYSVSSFYLVSSSLMGAFPERYGLQMLPNPSGLLEDAAFEEVGGLSWPEKKQQIIDSTDLITDTIRRIKNDPKYRSGAIDLELLFLLYDSLGHGRKSEIIQAYEQGFLGNPVHPKSYERTLLDHLATPPDNLRASLAKAAVAPQPEDLRLDNETMVLPLASNGHRIELELRCREFARGPFLAEGKNLCVLGHDPESEDTDIVKLTEPGSPLQRSLAAAGWEISERLFTDVSLQGVGFKLSRGDYALQITFRPATLGDPCHSQAHGIGMFYAVPHGKKDVTQEDRGRQLLEAIARYCLTTLGRSGWGKKMGRISVSAVREVASDLVATLESTVLDSGVGEATMAGRRHGDKFSRVEPASP